MIRTCALGFLGILSLCVPSCSTSGDVLQPLTDETNLPPGNDPDGSGGMGSCSGAKDADLNLVGTWAVNNYGYGTTGQVTFAAGGSYTIDNGMYNAGGTWNGTSSGTYKTLPGGAIAFTYDRWVTPGISRIAVVQCVNPKHIVHFVMGHTHDYEMLTRLR